MLGIIDTGYGNIHAISNCLRKAGAKCESFNEPNNISYDGLILPGVGNFDSYMYKLNERGFTEYLKQKNDENLPILGICVGMHALANSSEEGSAQGLGLISGNVARIRTKHVLPHMGWNSITVSSTSNLFNGIDIRRGFYFLHNFVFKTTSRSDIIADAEYGISITCAINKRNCFGVQFHPEKSHDNGIKLFQNFWEISQNAKA